MKRQLLTIAGTVFAIVMLMSSFGYQSQLQAQEEPDGYLIPMDDTPAIGNPTYLYRWDYQRDYYIYNGSERPYTYYKYQYNPIITDMKIYNADGMPLYHPGRDLAENREGSYSYEGDADNYTGDGILFPGSTYIVSQTVKYRYMENTWSTYCTSFWYYYYEDYYPGVHRVFVDFDRDAKFESTNVFDSGIDEWINGNTEEEYVQFFNKDNMSWDPYPWGNFYYYMNFCNSSPFVYEYQMTVPSDVEGGKTRIRYMAQTRWFKRDNYIYAWGPDPNFNSYRWYWFDPANANLSGYVYSWGNNRYQYFYNYGSTFDFTIEFGLPIEGLFPSSTSPDNILLAGKSYDGTWQLNEEDEQEFLKRPYVEMKEPQPAGTYLKYYIQGPLPKTDELYVAYDENGSEWHDLSRADVKHEFFNSEMNQYSPTGSGELVLPSGVYEVVLELIKPGQIPGVDEPKKIKYEFNVVWVNDLAVENIVEPYKDGPPNFTEYIRGINIPVSAEFKNMGLRTVYQFEAKAFISYSDGTLAEQFEYEFDARDEGTNPLLSLEKFRVDFPNYNTQQVDRYEILVTANLLSAEDQEPYNDRFERQDAEYPRTFVVKDEIEAAVLNPVTPVENGTQRVSRPFIPAVIFENNGISDVSDATATFVIRDSQDNIVKQGTTTVQEIASGIYNTKLAQFEAIDISIPGTYTIKFEIDANGDILNRDQNNNIVEENSPLYRNTYEYSFTVKQGLEGTITVGQGRDYSTLTEAVDALYWEGMNGPVDLVLYDKNYKEGHNFPEPLASDEPAIDFTTEIIGLGWDEENKRYNTLTIKPSAERNVERGGITIDLHTMSGVGFEFGQDLINRSFGAPIRERINDEYFTRFANSPGYITFDGGQNRSIKVRLFNEGSRPFGSAFHLQRGSHNIQVKNIIIENASPSLRNSTWLPGSSHSLNGGFQFEEDLVTTPEGDLSYSAGITNRGTLLNRLFALYDEEGNLLNPDDLNEDPNQEIEEIALNLDTIDNVNNVFKNNEIRGFGYGIVTMGMGALYHQNAKPRPQYVRHYNRNTVIEGNRISDVGRAGIYAGFEEDLIIKDNIIQDVRGESNDQTGQTAGQAFGIILGGDGYKTLLAQNNLNATVSSNTISGLSATEEIKGISVVQVDNRYVDPESGFQAVPGGNDNINVHSNAIWRIEAGSANTHRAGIHVYSERNRFINDFAQRMVTPKLADYVIEDVMVANNTVMIEEDGIENAGMTVGIGIQNTVGAVNKNNAIAVTDSDLMGEVNALMFYQGMKPGEGLVSSDYNVLYSADENVDMVRFVESYPIYNNNTPETVITHEGMSGEYKNLEQWQMWTGADYNSVSGRDFTNDYIESGVNPRRLAVVSPVPHSVLNNRGEIIEDVVYDVNGRMKGAADERYDVGAVEFDGKMYRRDVEVMLITNGVYRATEGGLFDDAEYKMVKDVIEVNARIRNNSSADLTDIPVYLTITNKSTGSTVETETQYVNIQATNTGEVTFLIDDRTDASDETDIKTFAELSISPDRVLFAGMEHNVTPIYEFDLHVDYDENNLNNEEIREMRFYIQRSPMQLAVSNTSFEPNTVTQEDELAVYWNSRAVYDAFERMGWKYEVAWNDDEIDEDRYDYDVFNRAGWYDRTVDYEIFRTMIWTDGNDIPLTRWEELSLFDYLMNDNTEMKKNLVIGSQEIVRLNENSAWTPDFDLIGDGLRAKSRYPHTPLQYQYPNADGNYSGYNVTGLNVARDLSFDIISTGEANDRDSYPALLEAVTMGEGNAKTAYVYNKVRDVNTGQLVDLGAQTHPEKTRVMGVAATSLYRNVVTLGVDWRHFGDPQSILRSTFDYIETNGGLVIPVELTTFTAEQVNNRVDLAWTTSSEDNSSHFEVEKAVATDAGRSIFTKIDEVAAAGNSGVTQFYAAKDKDINSGDTYIYRLKMVDLDGEFDYSSEVEVAIDQANGITLQAVRPNPVRTTATMQYTLANGMNVSVKVYDMAGKVVAELANGFKASGTHELVIDAQDLPSGSYNVVLTANGKALSTNVNIVK